MRHRSNAGETLDSWLLMQCIKKALVHGIKHQLNNEIISLCIRIVAGNMELEET